MKKILSVLFGSLILLLMFAVPGSPVQAEENDECGCVTEEISGAEKNKMVSNLLKSDEFKNMKKEQMQSLYKWKGVSEIEVIRNITFGGVIIITIPISTIDGTEMVAGFIDGGFIGIFPAESHDE
ncbi:MAG: hypothetical protein K6T88_00330 [Bacillus sp. (in: Bacteria)]|nr:hypothetical protein [Bacillus sp. (in: firmicutes)]